MSERCERRDDGNGYQICDRCGSIWGPLLGIELAWRPLSCVERKTTKALSEMGPNDYANYFD